MLKTSFGSNEVCSTLESQLKRTEISLEFDLIILLKLQ